MVKENLKMSAEQIEEAAALEVEKIEAAAANEKAIADAVKKKLAENAAIKRENDKREAAAQHDQIIGGIRKRHGDVMRVVERRYSAESKPMYIDKPRT